MKTLAKRELVKHGCLLAIVALCVVAGDGALAAAAQATTYTVGVTQDNTGACVPSSGTCSLRQIIAFENGLKTTPNPPDTLIVPAGTYNLSNGPLTITQSIAIAGAGARTTKVIQKSSTPDRVFDIQTVAATPKVGITGLTISGGTAGSANGFFGGDVRNHGALTLSEDFITGGNASSGGGISNFGGTMVVTHSLVSGNAASSGGADSGGIQNYGDPTQGAGTLEVDNSTIAGNTANLGGGIFSWCGGTNGACSSTGATNTTVVVNSTIANNDGGTRSTTGGGLLAGEGTMRVTNSIVAFNTVDTPNPSTQSNCGTNGSLGTITSAGDSLDTGTDCGFTAPGDLQQTDPEFSSTVPQNNGGNTDTLGLALTSLAVDHTPSNGSGCAGTDQRDVTRPQRTACDIGAFEFSVPPEGTQFSGALAFATAAISSSSQPTIDWGDGKSSPATEPPPGQTGPISGAHTYAEEGTFNGFVTWTDDRGPHKSSFTLIVPDAPLTAGASPVAATAGTNFSGQVATFADGNPSGTLSDFSASIDWGDGTVSAGTISAGSGGFSVSGAHTYAAAGSFATTVSIADIGGSHAAAHGNAAVGAAPAVRSNVTRPPALVPGAPSVTSSAAGFSGTVNPGGLTTTVVFQYGLDQRQFGAAGTAVVYDQSTPPQQVGPDFSNHPVSARASGLVPNALYHVRMVASNSAGTADSADLPFKTTLAPPPRPPVLGQAVDVKVVSGIVLIKPPPGKSLGHAPDAHITAVAKGQGFVPLTQARQIPTGSQIDATRGSLQIVSATGQKGKTQNGTFGGALFKLTQLRSRLSKGLTTLSLLEGAFRGAPTYASCPKAAADRTATASRLSSRVLQALHSSEHGGRYSTRGRYAAATVRGTAWDTIDRCDGTLTIVHRGIVSVTDLVRHKTITLHAGQRYLAKRKR